MLKEYVLEGTRIGSLDEFYDEFARSVSAQILLGRNLDALDDILRGGYGTPIEEFRLRWVKSAVSQARLNHSQTARELERRLAKCHPSNREAVSRELRDAQDGKGPTVFDWLVELIRDHGPGGEEATDNVVLVLD